MRLQLRCHGDIDLSQPGMQVEIRSHIARCLRDYANGGEGVLLPATPAIGYDWGARCSSSCTRAPARPCAGRARRTPPTITRSEHGWSSRYIQAPVELAARCEHS